jgi:cystathionine beta-lyase/cystathionine gamma-synthase
MSCWNDRNYTDDFATACIRGGVDADPLYGAILPPLYQTTTFRKKVVGQDQTYSYSRVENPTVAVLESRLGDLEGCLPAVTFSTGMSAVTTLFLTLLKSGDHIVCSDVVYGGTYRFFKEILANLGVTSSFVDTSDPEITRTAIRPETRVLLLETPANPTLKITDVAANCAIARDAGILSVVDNTFLTSVLQRPLDDGADITLYSTTKYIDGHNATVGGAICTRDKELRERLAYLRKCLGTIQTPHNAWLTLQGLKTLPLRLKTQSEHALAIARNLEGCPHINWVRHPQLESFPQRDLAASQQRAGGGLVTFELAGGLEAAVRTLGSLKLATPAENLGAVETLVTHNASMTHASVPPERRKVWGITDGLIRLSVGLESPDQILADLRQAIVLAHGEVAHA